MFSRMQTKQTSSTPAVAMQTANELLSLRALTRTPYWSAPQRAGILAAEIAKLESL